MLKKVQILFAILLLSACSEKADPNFHIYLCFGQSNMEGTGKIEAKDLIPNERFKIFQSLDCPNLERNKHQWYPSIPPSANCDAGLSPADYFGKTMVARAPENLNIGIISVAVGGCDIRLFDKDLYTDHDSTYVEKWFADKVAFYNGNPYQHLIDLAKLAQKDGVIKGILLHQGETNTDDKEWPNYVHKIYKDMLSDLNLSAQNVPILAGELVSTEGSCCASMNAIINTLPSVIPTAHVVTSRGCGASDNAHFNSEGYRVLGRRYAEKMLRIKGLN